MKVIQTRADVGEDRVLRVTLPEDTPVGPVEVLVVIEGAATLAGGPRVAMSPEARQAAARMGSGALGEFDLSTEEFLRERREDDVRRGRTLGL